VGVSVCFPLSFSISFPFYVKSLETVEQASCGSCVKQQRLHGDILMLHGFVLVHTLKSFVQPRALKM
jgi:hypothetical protein